MEIVVPVNSIKELIRAKISVMQSADGLRCGSMSAKDMGGFPGGCAPIGGPVRGLERGLLQPQVAPKSCHTGGLTR